MSGFFGAPIVPPPFAIVGPVRDGEGSVARTINFTPDLGASDGPGRIPSLADVTVTITRQDGQAIGASDVSLIPAQFGLDATGMLLTLWFEVPPDLPYTTGASQIVYVVTITVVPTASGQDFRRDGLLTAVALLG